MTNNNKRPGSQLSEKPDFDDMSYKISFHVTIITCSLFIIYGISNIIFEKYYIGFIETASGISVLIFNISFLIINKRYTAPALIINVMTVFLSAYLYWSGGFSNTGIFWCLVLPGLYISTRGLKRGIMWISVQLSLIGIIFLLSLLNIIEITYSGYETLAALIAYCFSCYLLITYELIRRKYRQEIRRLQGLLPICSVCKKIRDMEGNWQTVDKYLTKKADLDFTHGLCPECVEKHYKEYS